jgi:hypothetical protein
VPWTDPANLSSAPVSEGLVGRTKGLCSICGKGGKLTFEHVPPKSSYNEEGLKLFTLDHWLSKGETGEMTGGAPQPDGTGMVSLCKSCNENTGSWYVPEFAKLVHAGITLHQELNRRSAGDDPDKSANARVIRVVIKQMRPLPILKEIVAMLLAVNGPGFGQKNPALVEFVINKESRGLPSRYRIFLSLFRGPMARFAGLSTALRTDTCAITLLTEVAYPPFAYLLTIDSTPDIPIEEITAWVNAESLEVRDVELDLLVAFGHTPYPGDYRSRAAIDAQIARNHTAVEHSVIVDPSDPSSAAG